MPSYIHLKIGLLQCFFMMNKPHFANIFTSFGSNPWGRARITESHTERPCLDLYEKFHQL